MEKNVLDLSNTLFPMKRKSNQNIWVKGVPIILLSMVSIVLGTFVFDSKIDMNGDNTSYYSLAKVLSQFKGYVNSFGNEMTPHSHFPPGYPFIIAPFMWISKNLLFIKSLSTLFYISSVILGFFVVLNFNRTKIIESLFIALLLATNFHLLKYSTLIMSEIALVVCNMIFLFLFLKNEAKWKDSILPDWKLILLAFIGMLAFHIKTLAFPIIGAAFLFFLVRKKIKLAFGFLIWSFLFFLPYFLRNKIVGVGGGYLAELLKVNPYRPELGNLDLGGFLSRIETNFYRYIGKEIPHGLLSFPEVNSNVFPPTSHLIAGFGILFMILLGWNTLKGYRDFFLFYVVGTFTILLAWPEVWFGIRFMISLIPILLLLLGFGIIYLAQIISDYFQFNRSFLSVPIIGILLALNFGWVQKNPLELPTIRFLRAYSKADYPPAFKNYLEVAKWSKFNLPNSAPVACRKPGIFHMFYDGPALGYPQVPDQNEFIRLIEQNKTDYIVIDQLGYSSTARFVVPVVRDNPELFSIIYQTKKPETYLVQYLGGN
ncbi:MAG: hypothetical protein RLZZ248_1415 [Bacteroidota bacterium]